MVLVCPRCRRNLPSTESPPSYCSFCGQRLPDDPATENSAIINSDGSTVTQSPAISPELPPEESTPAEIGGYRLLRVLGVGGMGRVFEAESIATGQKAAVKLLSSQLARNPASVERFRQEGRLASQLTHPRCVFVFAADTEEGRPFIVMELMPGDTIKDLIDRRGPLPHQEAIPLILDVIDGLQEAHRFGVIHRDVKPSNCFMMPDGRVKVGDFGLSKSLSANAQLTQSGAFLGTVLYASPEQIRGEPVEYASDVYSVCATLYHMLAGRSAFQHENITAALAKIISEDAPALRSIRPEIPRALARVVEKGLERDRARRWQTLEELRAALVALVPAHLTYGGLTIRVGAYLLDELFVRLLIVLPLSVLSLALFGHTFEQSLPLFVFPLYFVLLEGTFGASLGKRLLRLRVCKSGSTDPPGLKQAALRTLVFYLLITVTLVPSLVLFEGAGGGLPAVLLASVPLIAGLLLLIVPMRKSNDFRGMHEMVSGTCVMQLPRRIQPLTLTSKRGSRLLAYPPGRPPVPAMVGPYAIKGAVGDDRSGYLLVGEDSLLGRRILLRVGPPSQSAVSRELIVNRPTRMRLLQSGTVRIGNADCAWDAYVAPAGAALTDVIQTHGRLRWQEMRPLIEQLAEELHAAEKEGSLPATLSLDQIWVQRDGRLQLLEFPLPRPGEAVVFASSPIDLLREVSSLGLEGQVRLAGAGYLGPMRAPVPFHAAHFLNRLLGGPNAFAALNEVCGALRETRQLPTHVDQHLRFAHLTVQSAWLAVGLTTMFLVSGLFAVFAIIEFEQHYRSAALIQQILDDGNEIRPAWLPAGTDQGLLRSALARRMDQDLRESQRLRQSLNLLERFLLPLIYPPDSELPPDIADRTIARALPGSGAPQPIFRNFGNWRDAWLLILIWPVLWAAGAFLLRGGFSYFILGIGIVDRDGRRATRKRCALRALLVWSPIALLLCSSVWLQMHHPQWVLAHSLMWFAAFLALPSYLALALVVPDRAVHDRILGCRLVPR